LDTNLLLGQGTTEPSCPSNKFRPAGLLALELVIDKSE